MKLRKLSRRSFLGQVAGGAVGAGALVVLAGEAGAVVQTDGDPGDRPGGGRTGVSDTDPRDRPGYGRGRRSGITDNDSGSRSDPPGNGRGRPAARTVTDRDSGPRSDPPNRRVCSDSDRGRGGDPVGRGRRC